MAHGLMRPAIAAKASVSFDGIELASPHHCTSGSRGGLLWEENAITRRRGSRTLAVRYPGFLRIRHFGGIGCATPWAPRFTFGFAWRSRGEGNGEARLAPHTICGSGATAPAGAVVFWRRKTSAKPAIATKHTVGSSIPILPGRDGDTRNMRTYRFAPIAPPMHTSAVATFIIGPLPRMARPRIVGHMIEAKN